MTVVGVHLLLGAPLVRAVGVYCCAAHVRIDVCMDIADTRLKLLHGYSTKLQLR